MFGLTNRRSPMKSVVFHLPQKGLVRLGLSGQAQWPTRGLAGVPQVFLMLSRREPLLSFVFEESLFAFT